MENDGNEADPAVPEFADNSKIWGFSPFTKARNWSATGPFFDWHTRAGQQKERLRL
jgi:hypothetical protein